MCLLEWSSDKIVPKMLACGHSFCGECLLDLYKVCANDEENVDAPESG